MWVRRVIQGNPSSKFPPCQPDRRREAGKPTGGWAEAREVFSPGTFPECSHQGMSTKQTLPAPTFLPPQRDRCAHLVAEAALLAVPLAEVRGGRGQNTCLACRRARSNLWQHLQEGLGKSRQSYCQSVQAGLLRSGAGRWLKPSRCPTWLGQPLNTSGSARSSQGVTQRWAATPGGLQNGG